MSNQALLPKQFEELTPFVAKWARPSEHERNQARYASTMEELRQFYDAMLPRMKDMLALLASYEPSTLPADVERLFQLTLSVAEVASCVELFGAVRVPDTDVDPQRLVPAHTELTGIYPR